MKENKTYQIYEILAVCAEWLNEPENADKLKAVEDIKTSLVIRDYMPIGQKELVMRKALIDMRSDTQIMPYTASILYEIALLFDCLLAYVVNLDANIDNLYKDASFYDILKMSGIIDYILSFCGNDYESLRKMADRMISFDNLNELVKNIELTSPEQIDRLTQEFKNFTTNINPEIFKHMGTIMAGNDPLLTNIKNTIEDEAFKVSQLVGEGSDDLN